MVITQPYRRMAAVTTSDATIIPVTRGLYIGGAGAVAVRTESGDEVTLAAVPVGTVLPIAVDMVKATGTVATLIIALY